jgi:hypothetical protein
MRALVVTDSLIWTAEAEYAVETFSREAFAGRLSSVLSQVGVETCA